MTSPPHPSSSSLPGYIAICSLLHNISLREEAVFFFSPFNHSTTKKGSTFSRCQGWGHRAVCASFASQPGCQSNTHSRTHTEQDGTRVFQLCLLHRNTLTLGPAITSWVSLAWMTHHVDISVWRDQWMKTQNCPWNTDPLVERLLFHFSWVWSYCTVQRRHVNTPSVVFLQKQSPVSHLGNAKHNTWRE